MQTPDTKTGYGTQNPLTREEKDDLERMLINAREVQLARLERRETRLVARPRVETYEEIREREYCAGLARKILAREMDPARFFGDEEVRLPAAPANEDAPVPRDPQEEAAYCAGLQKQIVARELDPEKFWNFQSR